MPICRLKLDLDHLQWLRAHGASEPEIIPTWPGSDLTALVAVLRLGAVDDVQGQTEAYVITTESDMDAVVDRIALAKLWVTMPWPPLLRVLPRTFRTTGRRNDARRRFDR